MSATTDQYSVVSSWISKICQEIDSPSTTELIEFTNNLHNTYYVLYGGIGDLRVIYVCKLLLY